MNTSDLARIIALYPGTDILLRVVLDKDGQREEGDHIVSALITHANLDDEISDVPILVIGAVEEHGAYQLE